VNQDLGLRGCDIEMIGGECVTVCPCGSDNFAKSVDSSGNPPGVSPASQR
jgi:hypothetical protein